MTALEARPGWRVVAQLSAFCHAPHRPTCHTTGHPARPFCAGCPLLRERQRVCNPNPRKAHSAGGGHAVDTLLHAFMPESHSSCRSEPACTLFPMPCSSFTLQAVFAYEASMAYASPAASKPTSLEVRGPLTHCRGPSPALISYGASVSSGVAVIQGYLERGWGTWA